MNNPAKKHRRICIVTTSHKLFDTRIFHKQAKSLAAAGFNVTLVAPYSGVVKKDDIRILPLPPSRNRFIRLFILPFFAYRTAKKQSSDIYHFHDPELLPWMVFLKSRSGAKVIYDAHEDLPKTIIDKDWIPSFFSKFFARIVDYLEKYFSRKFDFIFAAVPGIENNFRAAGAKNVIVVKNYPLKELFADSMRANEANENEFLLVYAGSLSKIRGIKEIIQAVGMANSNLTGIKIRLKLFGSFSGKKFEHEVKSLKEYKFVDYMGWVTPETVYDAEKRADAGIVCLHPVGQHSISLPIKLFEYMCASLPVIASNFDSWREIINNDNCGLMVDPLDIKEISEAIIFLANNRTEAKKMGERGRKAIMEKYNWKTEEKKLIDTYEKICAE